MEYLPEYESKSGTAFEFDEESILTLVRLDAFIATAVACLCSYETNKVGDHCQKLYHDTLSSFFS